MVKKLHRPARIPVPGNKVIEEYVGRVSTGTESLSVARMSAPPGWSEPFQKPEFDEVTIVLQGGLRVEYEGGHLDVQKGEMVLVEAGERIRYSNPFSVSAEYYAICAPAFSPETVNRES